MSQDLAAQMAKILTEYSVPIKPGDYVTITGNSATAGPLIEALFQAVVRRGQRQAGQIVEPVSGARRCAH